MQDDWGVLGVCGDVGRREGKGEGGDKKVTRSTGYGWEPQAYSVC